MCLWTWTVWSTCSAAVADDLRVDVAFSQVVDDIVARGAKPENIRIVAVVVAPPAMVKLSEKYKGEGQQHKQVLHIEGSGYVNCIWNRVA